MRTQTRLRAWSVALGVGSLSLLAACSSNSRGGAPEALHADASAIVGTYAGSAGQTVRVTESGEGFDLTVTRDGRTRTYDGYVLNIDGVTVWEIVVAQPADDTDDDDRPFVSTYLYTRTERQGHEVRVRRLRSEWLELQSREGGITAFAKTPEIAEGSAAIIARDSAAMEALLRRAVKDPAAFDEPEVFKKLD